MSLGELVSSLGLWVYPVVGLIGFFVAFVVVLVRISRGSKAKMASNARLPLEDGTTELAGEAQR